MSEKTASLLQPGGFFGTYRVVRLIGKGASGWVYLVDGPEAGTQYALKILDPEVAGRNPDYERRFVREAEFTMNARSPHLVEVYDAGQDAETRLCYLTMEYMPGGTLRDILRTNRRLSVRGAHAIALDVARALKFIEENGLVHRDVKPDNVLFTSDGRAKLTDLGITRFADGDESVETRTMAGKVVGTVGYMSPEQMMDPHAVDIRADIYSLGVILYEMLAGERPNASESAISSLAKALQGNVFPDVRTRRPDVPAKLAELVVAMVSPDAGDRPASAAYLLELLEEPDLLFVPEPAPVARRRPTAAGVAEAVRRDKSLGPALAAVAVSFLALLAAVVTLFVRR